MSRFLLKCQGTGGSFHHEAQQQRLDRPGHVRWNTAVGEQRTSNPSPTPKNPRENQQFGLSGCPACAMLAQDRHHRTIADVWAKLTPKQRKQRAALAEAMLE